MNFETQTAWWRPNTALEPAGRWRAAEPEARAASALPFRALLAFTFILVISPQGFFPSLAPFRLAFVTAAAAITTYLWDRFVRSAPLTIRAPEIRFATLLAMWALLTVPLSYWPGGSAAFLLDTFFKSVTIFWLLCNTVDTEEKLRRVLWALSLMSIPLAATAAWNFHTGVFVHAAARGEVVRIEGYTAPLTANPNDLALMLNLILPLSASLLLAGGKPLSRGLLVATITLSAAISLTFSRGGFLTLAATSIVFTSRRMKRPRGIRIAAILAAGTLCLPLLPSSYLAHLGTITNIQSDPTGSAQERWGDMLSAARFVVLHPIFGAGVGMNTLALNEVRGVEWRMVHNVYLEYAADLGLPGLVLFLLLLTATLRSASWARRAAAASPGSRQVSIFAEGIQTCLIGFAVAAMFHPVSYHFYFYYIAALAVAAKRIAAARAGEPAAA